MGAGYHGGFGNTLGKKRSENKESKTNDSDRVNYISRNGIIRELMGVTIESTIVANGIKDKKMSLNILGDNLFDYYVTPDRTIVGRHDDGKIYVRRSSIDLISTIFHEGIHALDYINGIEYDSINSELKAYRAEHDFQKAGRRKIEHATDDDIRVHVHRYYGRWKK